MKPMTSIRVDIERYRGTSTIEISLSDMLTVKFRDCDGMFYNQDFHLKHIETETSRKHLAGFIMNAALQERRLRDQRRESLKRDNLTRLEDRYE